VEADGAADGLGLAADGFGAHEPHFAVDVVKAFE